MRLRRHSAATNFLRAFKNLNDLATVFGWTTGKVQQIAMRYVSEDEIARALADKMRQDGMETVNRAVNRGIGRAPFGEIPQ